MAGLQDLWGVLAWHEGPLPIAQAGHTPVLRACDLQALYEAQQRTRTADPFLTMEVLYQLS